MENVSEVFVDENRPPLPIRCNSFNISKYDAVPGTSGGYICRSSFNRDVFIRYFPIIDN